MMQNHNILIPALTKSHFPKWVTKIRLQAGDLGLTPAIEDPNFTPDQLLVRTIASLTNAILESIPSEVKSEAIHGTSDLKLYPLLLAINSKFNLISTVDHEELELKATRTNILNFDTVEDYFLENRLIRSQMLVDSYHTITHKMTTMKFIIREFVNHPDFLYVISTWASQPRPQSRT